MKNPEQAAGAARGMVAYSSELRSSSTLSGLIERVGVVPELRYACSGLFIFDAFGVICYPHYLTIKLRHIQT
jgi:hypothetical protein